MQRTASQCSHMVAPQPISLIDKLWHNWLSLQNCLQRVLLHLIHVKSSLNRPSRSAGVVLWGVVVIEAMYQLSLNAQCCRMW